MAKIRATVKSCECYFCGKDVSLTPKRFMRSHVRPDGLFCIGSFKRARTLRKHKVYRRQMEE